MKLYSILCTRLDVRRAGGRMDTCICMTASFHGSPETFTTWLISYIQIQRIFGIKKINKNKIKKKPLSIPRKPTKNYCQKNSFLLTYIFKYHCFYLYLILFIMKLVHFRVKHMRLHCKYV